MYQRRKEEEAREHKVNSDDLSKHKPKEEDEGTY
jgi:hypothetical protein